MLKMAALFYWEELKIEEVNFKFFINYIELNLENYIINILLNKIFMFLLIIFKYLKSKQ